MEVRPITALALGGPASALWRTTQTPDISIIDIATFHSGRGDKLQFRFAKGQPVKIAVFAATFDTGPGSTLERAYILMTPLSSKPQNLMIVITHGFGRNNDAYYSGLGYSNPLSPDLIKDVNHNFVLGRWGAQLMAWASDYALLLPVRARGGGHGELGPFISQASMGMGVVEGIWVKSQEAFRYDSVDVVTFSSGIYDANHFIAVGGKGLNITGACNQDPAGGNEISRSVPVRRQFLSGMTTKGPRPGFEYLPLYRWENEPNRKTMFPNDTFNYLHSWCIPMYTLFLAMQGP
ncbi:MAG: hypothetical protein ACLQLC_07820 [Candidatus Sulfotelmatobacter sp.]